jgi:hypothetical protein
MMGAVANQKQIARHLAQHVAHIENGVGETEHGSRQTQLLVHRERRETDIDPIEIGQHVEHEQKRNQAPEHLADHEVPGIRSCLRRRDG